MPSTRFLELLASRRRFGMRKNLEVMRRLCHLLGFNSLQLGKIVHIAGTNGKGAVAAMIESCLRRDCKFVARYTSPHLVRVNERFLVDGELVPDGVLEESARKIERFCAIIAPKNCPGSSPTYFETLTAIAFDVFMQAGLDWTILETGLGGRLDATNVCAPKISVITRIGLDHCDWLGNTLVEIAAEKAGIIKWRTPVVLGENEPEVRDAVAARARFANAPFIYAPDVVSQDEIPPFLSLAGSFNRENARTAIAAMKVMGAGDLGGLADVVWPGRFQRIGRFLVDGAHNPPAASALAAALGAEWGVGVSSSSPKMTLVCGFCGDKDVEATLRILAPCCTRAFAVRTNNPRSLEPDALAAKLDSCGIPSRPSASLAEAFALAQEKPGVPGAPDILVCGSLFLAGEAVVALGAYPWGDARFDPSESLVPQIGGDAR